MSFWDNMFGDNLYLSKTSVNVRKVVDDYLNLVTTNYGDSLVFDGCEYKLRSYSPTFFEIKGTGCSIKVNPVTKSVEWVTSTRLFEKRTNTTITQRNPFHVLQDLIYKGEIVKSTINKIRDVYIEAGVYKKASEVQYGLQMWITKINGWVSIHNGEYCADRLDRLYRYHNWELVTDLDEILEIISGVKIVESEDPRVEHWEHFLRLDMVKTKARTDEMKEWVDKVLAKKTKYDDLNILYENLPSAPITDCASFRNFCKLVKEPEKYEDYEITNYLLLLGVK